MSVFGIAKPAGWVREIVADPADPNVIGTEATWLLAGMFTVVGTAATEEFEVWSPTFTPVISTSSLPCCGVLVESSQVTRTGTDPVLFGDPLALG